MKRIVTAYLILVVGIPVVLAASCLVFRDLPVGPFVLFGVPILMFAVFVRQAFAASPDHRIAHAVGGAVCTGLTWFVSALSLGIIALSQSGLKGIQ